MNHALNRLLTLVWILALGMPSSLASAQGSDPSTPGLRAYWNTNTNGAENLGQIDWAYYDLLTIIDNVDFANTTDTWSPDLPDDHFGVRIVGQIDIPADGIWSFRLGADDGMQLWIDGELIVNDPGLHSYRSKTGIKSLTPGKHDIEIHFWDRTIHAGLQLYWEGPTIASEEIVPASAFSHTAAEPIYDAGGDGLWAYWFDHARHASNVGQIDWNDADVVTSVQRASFRRTNGAFRVDGPTDYFAVRLYGIINMPDAGVWDFQLGSDQSAVLLIDGETVIADPDSHSFRWRSGSIDLAAGDHTFEVRYWDGWSDAGLTVSWQGPNDEILQVIPSSAFRPGDGAPNPTSSGGLRAYRYDSVREASNVGGVDWVNHDSTETVQNVYWPITTGAFFTNGPTDYHAVRLVGKINFPRAGEWTIGLGSDQSARLYLGGQVAIDDTSSHSYRWRYGTGPAPEGEMDFELRYWEGWSDAGLVLTWKGPGDEFEQVIPASALSINETDPPLGTGGEGLRVYWVDNARHASKVGHIDWQNYDRVTYEANIAWGLTTGAFPGTTITTDEGSSTSFGGLKTDYFGLRAVGLIDIPSDGEWTFKLGSDQSAQLFIDGQMLINDDESHSYHWRSGTVELEAGEHAFEVRYWEGWSDAGLSVTWIPPGGVETVIPASAFSHASVETDYDSGGGGLRAYWATNARHASNAGQLDWTEHDHATTVPNIAWRIGTDPFDNDTPSDYYGLRLLGQLDVPATGSWTFSLGSDQSAVLLIDGEAVVVDTTSHSYHWRTGTVQLAQGKHDIEVRYWEGWSDAGLHLAWRGPTVDADIIIPRTAYSLMETEAPLDTGGGLRAYWTTNARHASNAGQIDYAEHATTSIVDNVSWPVSSSAFYLDGPTDYFGLRLLSELTIPESGTWTFNLGSDQSAILLIDDEPVIVDTSSHSYHWRSGTVDLDEGAHKFEVRYWEGWSDAGLNVTWKSPSASFEEIIPASAFNAYDPEPVYDNGESSIVVDWYTMGRGIGLSLLDTLTPTKRTTEPRISWNITRDPFVTGVPSDYFAFRATGRLIVPQSGTWTFGVGSDQYAKLIINGETVVDDQSSHSYHWRSGTINLDAGEYDLELQFMEGWSDAGVFLSWTGPDDQFETIIPASAFVPNTRRARVVQWKEIGGDHNR
ncbi:MAG: hypothetical protein KC996_07165 [Phycisphaerales bacterium]|nr:hypothetical protein [Phycisphaerales bacterium]